MDRKLFDHVKEATVETTDIFLLQVGKNGEVLFYSSISDVAQALKGQKIRKQVPGGVDSDDYRHDDGANQIYIHHVDVSGKMLQELSKEEFTELQRLVN